MLMMRKEKERLIVVINQLIGTDWLLLLTETWNYNDDDKDHNNHDDQNHDDQKHDDNND